MEIEVTNNAQKQEDYLKHQRKVIKKVFDALGANSFKFKIFNPGQGYTINNVQYVGVPDIDWYDKNTWIDVLKTDFDKFNPPKDYGHTGHLGMHSHLVFGQWVVYNVLKDDSVKVEFD